MTRARFLFPCFVSLGLLVGPAAFAQEAAKSEPAPPNATMGPPAPKEAAGTATAKHKQALEAALRKLDNLEPLTSADHTALKKAALDLKLDSLRVCGDPGNMPLSDINRNGFQNKIVELVAEAMGTRVQYFWRPYLERGITRQTFETRDCEVLLDIPTNYDQLLTTAPIYRTTYVLAYRKDSGFDITSLDDPKLKELKIGVFQTSGIRQALTARGIIGNVSLHVLSHNADLKPENQPWQQVQQVIDGKLDVAAVWGPFAGWLVTMKDAPLVIKPVNLWDDTYPMEFDLSMGLPNSDQILKYKLELAFEEKKAEIEKILRDYGVPLVECSRCVVQGDIPAHGAYEKLWNYKEPEVRPEAAAHQKVTRERLEAWLAEGADLGKEFANAVLAKDVERIKFLVEKGANINGLDDQGYTALHSVARHSRRNVEPELLKVLIDLKADVNVRDSGGYTPLLHAVLRDHASSVKVLAAAGADVNATTSERLTPLAVAIAEDRYFAAMALIEAGASISAVTGEAKLTPLMLAAGKQALQMHMGAGRRTIEKYNPQDPGSLDVAQALLQKGADVNAVSATGLTALHLAAAHNRTPIVGLLVQSGADASAKTPEGKTALDIAKDNGNNTVVSILGLLEQSGNN